MKIVNSSLVLWTNHLVFRANKKYKKIDKLKKEQTQPQSLEKLNRAHLKIVLLSINIKSVPLKIIIYKRIDKLNTFYSKIGKEGRMGVLLVWMNNSWKNKEKYLNKFWLQWEVRF